MGKSSQSATESIPRSTSLGQFRLSRQAGRSVRVASSTRIPGQHQQNSYVATMLARRPGGSTHRPAGRCGPRSVQATLPNCWILPICRADTMGTGVSLRSPAACQVNEGGYLDEAFIFALAAVALVSASVGCNRQFIRSGTGYGAPAPACNACDDGCSNGLCSGGDYGDVGGGVLGDTGGPRHCQKCRVGLRDRLGRCNNSQCAASGPPVAQVAYPYYTVRGPRTSCAATRRRLGRRPGSSRQGWARSWLEHPAPARWGWKPQPLGMQPRISTRDRARGPIRRNDYSAGTGLLVTGLAAVSAVGFHIARRPGSRVPERGRGVVHFRAGPVPELHVELDRLVNGIASRAR